MPKKYEFLYGRFGLALLYGWATVTVLTIVVFTIVSSVPFLTALFDRSSVFVMISIMVPMFSPWLYFFYLPPERSKVNIMCVGILHDDYVEIHKGKKVRRQRYEDIKRVYKYSFRGTAWRIGKVYIYEAIGVRKKHIKSDTQTDRFMKAVEFKIMDLKEKEHPHGH